jgi:hypothetical protein
MNLDRAAESNEFSEKAQKKFDKDERGSEEVIDMYEKGSF